MMAHKIYFSEEIWIIIPKLSLLLLLIWSPVVHNIRNITSIIWQKSQMSNDFNKAFHNMCGFEQRQIKSYTVQRI